MFNFSFGESIAYCEAQGVSKVFAEYAQHHAGEEIESLGFNSNSGYVYLSLECGFQIVSMLGADIEYCLTDFYTGEEIFFDSWAELLADKKI
jgi:hypothetical protein